MRERGYWSGGVNDSQLNTMLMNSPEHRANIVGPYHHVGTAWAIGAGGAANIAVEFSQNDKDSRGIHQL